MRLWSLHPHYLDRPGLSALWREALLARAVLEGKTTGYRNHPQLQRFRTHPSPTLAIAAYLAGVHDEAQRRGYRFDATKIGDVDPVPSIEVTTGQIEREWAHLLAKLAARSPDEHSRWAGLGLPDAHPLFIIRPGPVARWERAPPLLGSGPLTPRRRYTQ